MTLLAAASPATPFQLTEPNLRSHTSLEGIAPRRTVQIYLNGITEAQGFFDIPSDTIVDSETPPSLGTLAAPRALAPAPSSSKRRQHVDSSERDEPAANTALVMHTHFAPQGALKTGAASSARPHKKPSLVSAMRPRLSSVPRKPSPEQDTGKEARRKDPSALPAPNGNKENTRVLHRRERANRGRKIEVFDSRVGPAVDKSAEKGKGRLRAEVEDDEEAKELEERLEARRERRRNKAFIRKDRSQTAKATGIAAAAAITKTNKRRTHGDEISDPEGETIGRPQSKKGRRSAEQSGREVVQGLDRPAAIGPGRLTLKSSTQLGMFNKGKASARVEVGKAVPDLAFSEMRFLNSTRLTHAMFELESSSGEEGATAAAEATQAEQMSSSLRKTYGSKKSGGRRLSSRAQIEEATSIVSTGARDLPRHTRPANPRQKIADWPPASEIPQSRHERELGSRSSSRSSRRQQGLEPEQIACDDSLRPRHDALGAVAQESDFSAHSAHSLAVRRRARRGVFHSFPPTQETEHHQEQQSDESMQAEEGAEAQRAQVVQEASLSSPHKGRSPDSGPPGSRSEPPQKQGSLSRFSLDTASIDRILRDNSSSERHVDVRLQSTSDQMSSSMLLVDDGPEFPASFDSRLDLPSNKRCRLRSLSSSVSLSSPKSDVSLHLRRRRSLSDPVQTNLLGTAREDFDPFSRPGLARAPQALIGFGPGGEDDGHDTGGYADIPGASATINTRELESRAMDDDLSPPTCRSLEGGTLPDSREEVHRSSGMSHPGLDESVFAGLWHKNVL